MRVFEHTINMREAASGDIEIAQNLVQKPKKSVFILMKKKKTNAKNQQTSNTINGKKQKPTSQPKIGMEIIE